MTGFSAKAELDRIARKLVDPPAGWLQPLDVSDPATLERWCDAPDHDTRTIEEFAADCGMPVGPPNRRVGRTNAAR